MSQLAVVPSPLLSGGVSQQAAHQRFPGQVQSASNADFTVIEGLCKRRGTRLERVITGLDSAGTYRLHPINRDSTEPYLVIHGRASGAYAIQVIRLNDTSAFGVCTVSGMPSTYLNSSSATADQVRLLTIADYTLIANTQVATAAGASSTYELAGKSKNYTTMLSMMPTNGTYWQAEEDDELQPKGYWYYYAYDGGSPGAATVFGSWVGDACDSTNSAVSAYTASGGAIGSFRIFFQKVPITGAASTWTPGTRTLVHASLGSSLQSAAGSHIYVTSGTGWTPGYYLVESHTAGTNTCVLASGTVPVGGTSSGASAGTDVPTLNGWGWGVQATANFKGRTISDMHDVAKVFESAIREEGVPNALVSWSYTSTTVGRFTVVGPYSGSDSSVKQPLAPIGSAIGDFTDTDEAFDSASGTETAGSGGSTAGQYTPAQRWTRVAAPAQNKAVLTNTTLPVKMVRTSAGTIASSASVFTVSAITWDNRTSGDENSNPLPELINTGQRIADMTYFRDRLVLAGGEHILFSASGDYFNFFAEDAANAQDSDPIQRQLSTEEVTLVDYLVPMGSTLVVFTKSGRQFEIGSSEAFTTATATTKTSTSYQSQSAQPAFMHNRIYFAGTSGSYASLIEYVYDEALAATTGNTVTAHVPELLTPATVRTIVCAQSQNLVVVLPSSGQSMFVYRMFFNGNRKEQSAWTTWTLHSGYRIADVAVLNDKLYMLIECASQYTIESITLGREGVDSGYAFVTHMDRRYNYTSGTFGGGNTTWTLPSSLSDTSINCVVTAAGTVYTATCNGTTVTVAGVNLSSTAITVGRTYTLSVELSQAYLRDREGLALIHQGFIVQRIVTNHQNSGPYTIRVDYTPNTTDHSTSFTVPTGSVLSTRDTLSAWVMNLSDSIRVYIEATDPKPVVIPTVTHIGWPAEVPR